jgi:acyl-ACP thioesterase
MIMYEFESRIRYSEVDANQTLTILGLIDYFQNCSTFHSEDLDIGVDYLMANHVGWVVVSYQVIINRLPRLGEHVRIQTSPYSLKGMFGSRNYAMIDASGNRLAYADSLWVLMDLESGKPTRILPKIEERYELAPAFDMPKKGRKILLPDDAVAEEGIPVQRYFLDTNHHMNNGKYIMVAESYLPEDFKVASFRVEYRNQAHLGDILYPYVSIADGKVTVSLCDAAKSVYASLEFLS